MKTPDLVTLLACLCFPGCAVSAASPVPGPAATADGAGPTAPTGDWSCLAVALTPAVRDAVTATLPPATSSPDTFTLHFVAAYSDEGVGGVQVTACPLLDDACTAPMAQAQADDQGHTTLTLPGGLSGFDGYLKVYGPGMTDNYVFLGGRAPADAGTSLDVVVYPPSAVAITAQLSGVAFDPTRGLLRVDTRDCSGVPAAGAQVLIGSNDPFTATEYSVGDGEALSRTADVTDATGVALGLGMAPGAVGVAAKLDGQPVGGAIGFVSAGAVTSIVVRP
jgi:hypothetical protein